MHEATPTVVAVTADNPTAAAATRDAGSRPSSRPSMFAHVAARVVNAVAALFADVRDDEIDGSERERERDSWRERGCRHFARLRILNQGTLVHHIGHDQFLPEKIPERKANKTLYK